MSVSAELCDPTRQRNLLLDRTERRQNREVGVGQPDAVRHEPQVCAGPLDGVPSRAQVNVCDWSFQAVETGSARQLAPSRYGTW